MPQIPNSAPVQEPFELLYLNGQPQVSSQLSVPGFRDIRLAKDTQSTCDSLAEEAKNCKGRIRSETECNDYVALHALVDEAIRKLNIVAKQDRAPFVRIQAQITAAIEPMLTELRQVSLQLRDAVTQWRDEVLEGKRREQERLEREVAEKQAEAKYSIDPVKKRQATVAAKALEKEAKKAAASEPAKGLDTEEYWEGKIVSRKQAAGLPNDIVEMVILQDGLNKNLKARERAGERITATTLPGIRIERKTRVRFHR